MKRAIATSALLAGLTLGLSTIALADGHEDGAESAKVRPVEVYACKFRDGKTMDDFNDWAKRWNRFMDKNGDNDYQAVVLTPSFTAEFAFDIGWVGYTSSGVALGNALDTWRDKSGDLNEEVYSILACDTHSNYASLTIKPPPGPMPKNPVLTFSDCNVKDGANFEEVLGAIDAWNEFRTEGGQKGPAWVWFPAYGAGQDIKYDFKYLEGFENYADWGADWDLFGNGGGWQKMQELFADKLKCDSGRVYNVRAIRIADDG